MKKILQNSEDSSFFRNDITATPEQQTRRASYSVPSKQSIIKQIFEFYTKQSYAIGVNATFDRQLKESNLLNLAKFFHFCKDFNITFLTKQELTELFRKCATFGKQLNLQQFEQLINLLAFYRGINLHQFYAEIGLDNWNQHFKKMKLIGKPFHMKDETERFKKEEIKYQFKLFHPDVKDQSLLKDLLYQRKQNHEKIRNQEKQKKEIEKIQFELKFLSAGQLIEKYPESSEMINKLAKKKVKQHIEFVKPFRKVTYSIQQSPQKHNPDPIITWEGLENIQPNKELLKELIGQNIDEDICLPEYRSIKHPARKQPNSSQANYGCLNLNTRSLSDQFSKKNKNNKQNNFMCASNHEEIDQFVIQPEKKAFSNKKECLSPLKSPKDLSFSMMQRANQIQHLEKLKEKQLIDMILYSHKKTVQNVQPLIKEWNVQN